MIITKHSTDGLCLQIYMDTLTTKAIFKLSCKMFFKFKNKELKGNKQSIYLFIYPDDIRTITLQINKDVPSLHFSMERPPRLIVPRERILITKQSTKHLLRSFQALATVASIFSSTGLNNRLSTDGDRANLQRLYGGTGGIIANASTFAASARGESGLPAYHESASSQDANKRKRKRECSSDADSERSLTMHDNALSTKDVRTRPDAVERRLEILLAENLLDGLKSDMKARFDGVETRIRHLEDNIADGLGAGRSPSRYGTEEIDTRVGICVDESMEDLKTECRFTIQEGFQDITTNVDELGEAVEQLEHRVKDTIN
ncbi:hypothetical protein V8C37DRAFT_420449 [Trichoderma ceciliae]